MALPSYTHHTDVNRMRLSENGKWVVRLSEFPYQRLDSETYCATARREFGRLRQLGLKVISFTNAPGLHPKEVITITPWIPQLEDITAEQYGKYVKPPLLQYYQEAEQRRYAGPPYITGDIITAQQYSTVQGEETPLLHDVDPFLHSGPGLAQSIIARLKQT